MRKELEELLEKSIEEGLNDLNEVELGSEEHRVANDAVCKLIDKAIELDKLDAEKAEKESNLEIKFDQLEQEKKDSKIRNGLTAAGIAVPSLITIWGVVKTFKFEEAGTITSSVGRNFISKLLRK